MDLSYASVKLVPLPADMLFFAVVFVRKRISQSACAEHLSSPPSLSSEPSEPYYYYYYFVHSFAPFSIYRSSSHPSSHQRCSSCGLGHFPATILSEYLIGCVNHCYFASVVDNHCNDVNATIPQTNEWCKFPICCYLKRACRIWVP